MTVLDIQIIQRSTGSNTYLSKVKRCFPGFLLAFALAFTCPLWAQKQSTADSLLGAFNNTSLHDTLRVQAIHAMAIKFAFSIPDSAFVIAHKELAFATSRNLPRYQAGAFNTMGICFVNKGMLDSALKYYTLAYEIRHKLHDRKAEGASLNNIGIVYFQRGEYTRAIEYYQKSLAIKDSLGDKSGVAATYSNIGMIYENQGDTLQTLAYYNKGLQIRDSLNDARGLADSYQKMGGYYMAIEDYDNAWECIQKSVTYAIKSGDDRTLRNGLSNIGHIHAIRGQNDSAMAYYQKSLLLRTEGQDDEGIARSNVEIGDFYNDLGRFEQALPYCIKGLEIADEIGFPEIQRDGCNCLAKAYEGTGNPAKALEHYKRAVRLNDSLSGIEKSNEITRKALQYDFEKEKLADSLRQQKENELIDIQHNEELEQQQVYTYIGIAGFVLMLVLTFVLLQGYRNKQSSNLELARKNNVIEEKQKAILDSITYAKRLQEAILPSFETVNQLFPENFVIYKPKDIVAGDFYWLEHLNGITFIAAADCTGHGVPGAMVSVVCSNALNRSVLEFGITDPGKILDKTRELVLETFAKSDKDVMDGMDISLAAFNGSSLLWAGANNPLWVVQNKQMQEVNADKQPIGKTENSKPFSTKTVLLEKGSLICLLTDGFADQFGGPKGKKFKQKQLKELLVETSTLSIHAQKTAIEKTFEDWRGKLEQVDDVCLIGIRIS